MFIFLCQRRVRKPQISLGRTAKVQIFMSNQSFVLFSSAIYCLQITLLCSSESAFSYFPFVRIVSPVLLTPENGLTLQERDEERNLFFQLPKLLA